MFLLLLFILPGLFFLKLFIPRLMLFYPADFLLSDLIHVNFAQKYYLFEALKQNTLPFWTNQVSQGYPLLAESQIGALNLFNIILYKLFSVELAFNLTYLLGFIFLAISLFFLGQYLYKDRLYALLFSVSFTFSGIVMQQIVHQGILQNIFLLPIVFYLLFKGVGQNNRRLLALAGFFFAQQFLFGHLFVNLAQLLFMVVFFLFKSMQKNNNLSKILVCAVIFFSIYILLIIPQLVQSYIFYLNSNRIDENSGSNLITASFELKYLLSFLYPFPFGKISDGSFFRNRAWQNTTTAPWEASIFVGYGLILITMVNLFCILKKNTLKKSKNSADTFYFNFFTIGLILAALLMFGAKTPLKIIFTLPIINSFRIVARFSLFTSFFLIGYILFQAKRLALNKNVLILALLLQIAGGFFFFYNYYPLVDAPAIFRKPTSAIFLNKKPGSSVYSFETQAKWFDTFQQSGYALVPRYIYYHNSLYPYLNLIYHTHSCNIFRYSNYNPANYQKIVKFLDNELWLSVKKRQLTKAAYNYLQLLGCDYLLLHSKIKASSAWQKIADELFIYEVPKSLPKFAFYQNVKSYLDNNQFLNLLTAGRIDFQKLYLNNFSLTNYPATTRQFASAQIRVIKDKNGSIRLHLYSDVPGYLLVRQLNYPGWRAKVNKQTVKIINANMLYMAVPIDKGDSVVEFTYHPPLWTVSLIAMAIGYLLTVWVLVFGNKNPKKDIF